MRVRTCDYTVSQNKIWMITGQEIIKMYICAVQWKRLGDWVKYENCKSAVVSLI